MRKEDFKVGDRVRLTEEHDLAQPSWTAHIRNISNSENFCIEFDGENGYDISVGHIGNARCSVPSKRGYFVPYTKLEKVSRRRGRPVKPKAPEEVKRYMIYGTGCYNKSETYTDLGEAKGKLKEFVNDSDWTGDILLCELKPLYQAENKVVVKSLTKTKAKKKTAKKRKKR